MRLLLSDRYWIVSGEKGSGKTAIKRAFVDTKLNIDHGYNIVGSIDFDELEFETFQENLLSLARVAQSDPLRLLINIWTFTLIAEAAKLLIKNGYPRLRVQTIDNLSSDLTAILQGSMDSPGKRFRKIVKLPVTWFIDEKISNNPQDAILSFPLEYESFKALRDDVLQYLETRQETMLIVLDGFDRVCTLTRDPQYNCSVFEGLCEAVVKLRNDPRVRNHLHLKVLLPHDRFLPMLLRGAGESPVRDAVKIRDIHNVILWNKARLTEFLQKKISVGLPRSAPESLNSILPPFCTNGHYTSIEESSFDYILRHTMWRPRHLQQHMITMTELYADECMDQHRLRVAVAQTCQELVQEFIEEYSIDHPNIARFIRLFRGKCNVMPFDEFTGILKSALSRLDENRKWSGNSGFNQKLEALFRMGFFGVVHEVDEFGVVPPDVEYLPPWKLHGKRYYIEFYYRSKEIEPVYLRVANDNLVAIHPIFFNHCSMNPHSSIIVG